MYTEYFTKWFTLYFFETFRTISRCSLYVKTNFIFAVVVYEDNIIITLHTYYTIKLHRVRHIGLTLLFLFFYVPRHFILYVKASTCTHAAHIHTLDYTYMYCTRISYI